MVNTSCCAKPAIGRIHELQFYLGQQCLTLHNIIFTYRFIFFIAFEAGLAHQVSRKVLHSIKRTRRGKRSLGGCGSAPSSKSPPPRPWPTSYAS